MTWIENKVMGALGVGEVSEEDRINIVDALQRRCKVEEDDLRRGSAMSTMRQVSQTFA